MAGFRASAGIRWGGAGRWASAGVRQCQAMVTEIGLIAFLDRCTSFMTGWWKLGLYMNDRLPLLQDTLSQYTPADFSGYSGPQLIYGFPAGTMIGERAQAAAYEITFTHDGGPSNCTVYGYYIEDNTGRLSIAERFCDGPIEMDRTGRQLRIRPTFWAENERE